MQLSYTTCFVNAYTLTEDTEIPALDSLDPCFVFSLNKHHFTPRHHYSLTSTPIYNVLLSIYSVA